MNITSDSEKTTYQFECDSCGEIFDFSIDISHTVIQYPDVCLCGKCNKSGVPYFDNFTTKLKSVQSGNVFHWNFNMNEVPFKIAYYYDRFGNYAI